MNGGGDSVCIMIGASNHSLKVRERNDYYATPPVAVERLLELEEFHGRRILEPCCGEGHISKVLERRYEVVSNDLIDRGFGNPGIDFLGDEITEWDGDIVMNPPYGLSMEFVVKALDILSPGRKLAAFLIAWNIQTCDGGSHRRKDRENGGLYITKGDICLTLSTLQPRECVVLVTRWR